MCLLCCFFCSQIDLGELRPWSAVLNESVIVCQSNVLKVVVPGIWDCDYHWGGE